MRTLRFFLRVASRDAALHFARVAVLDSAVCIVLSALVKPIVRAIALVETFDEFTRMKRGTLGFRASMRMSLGPSCHCWRTLRSRSAVNW
jgi:hypothetical protein